MTDPTKKMAKAENVYKAVTEEMLQHSVTRDLVQSCDGVKEELIKAAMAFNALQADMVRVKNVIFGVSADCRKFAEDMSAYCGNDVMSYVAKVKRVPLSEVEDTARFEALLKAIKGTANPTLRMRKCVKAKHAIDEAIDSRQSKLDGLREHVGREDANPNERENSEALIIRLGKMVNTLEVRRNSVMDEFYATKRTLMSFIENQSKAFSTPKEDKE